MSPAIANSLYRGLTRGVGILLVGVAVLFQRRGLMSVHEALFLLACVVMQEAYLHVRSLGRVRTLLIAIYFALPTVLLILDMDKIEPFRGDPVQLIQNTPLPLVLVSVQIMVLYVRESARLTSIVLVLVLFSTVIGLKRPGDDVTWTWLLLLGALAAAYVALTYPARMYHALFAARGRPLTASSPAGAVRVPYLSALWTAVVSVPVLAALLFFSLPRIDFSGGGGAASNTPVNLGGGRSGSSGIPRDGGGGTRRDGGELDPVEPPSVTGLSSHVDLGDFGTIKQSNTVLGEVKLGQPTPNPAPLYLRTHTFGRFDGEHWTPIEGAGGRVSVGPGPTISIPGQLPRNDADWLRRDFACEFERGGIGSGGELPLICDPVELRGLSGKATWDSLTGVFTTTSNDDRVKYGVSALTLKLGSDTLRSRFAGVRPLKPEDTLLPDAYWEVPADLLRLLQTEWRAYRDVFAQAWNARDGRRNEVFSAYAAARFLAEVYFPKSTVGEGAGARPAFEYSLSKRPGPGKDAIHRFLTIERYGHCEYFASAACMALRAVGVPCRLAVGFLTTDYAADSDAYVVRASDAHAWIEVYTETLGWIALDPTPPQGRVPPPVEPPPTPTADGGDKPQDPPKPADKPPTVEKPADPFESFNRDAQSALWRSSTDTVRDAVAGADAVLSPVLGWLPDFLPRHGLWRAILIATGPMLVLLLWLWRTRRRKRMERQVLKEMGVPAAQRHQRGLYLQLLMLLAQVGYHKRPSETPREFAKRIIDKAGEPMQPLSPLTELFYLARFSLTKAAGDAEKEFKRALSVFAEQLRRQPPEAQAASSESAA